MSLVLVVRVPPGGKWKIYSGQSADKYTKQQALTTWKPVISACYGTRSGSVEYTAYYTLSHLNVIECQWAIKITVLFECNGM